MKCPVNVICIPLPSYLNSATYIRAEHESFVGSGSPDEQHPNGAGDDVDNAQRHRQQQHHRHHHHHHTHQHQRRRSGRDGGFGDAASGGDDDDDDDDGGIAVGCANGNGNGGGDGIDDDKLPLATDASIYMPPLDLDRNSWSSNDLTYTHRKGDAKNSKELIRKTEAFKEWLSAKMCVFRKILHSFFVLLFFSVSLEQGIGKIREIREVQSGTPAERADAPR